MKSGSNIYFGQLSLNLSIFFDQSKKEELEHVQRLKTEISDISSRLGNVSFQYNDPVKHFDRSKVKGIVAWLLHVKDISAVTALEVCTVIFFQVLFPMIQY
jgi:hypothetical protein